MDLQELADIKECLRQRDEELNHCRLFVLKADRLQLELDNFREILSKTKAELNEARESHLHPANVAKLKTELQQAKYEVVAAENIKKALQSSLEYAQSKLALDINLPHCDPIIEDTSFMLETSYRNVYSRLYEDAMRRRYQFSDILDTACVLRGREGDAVNIEDDDELSAPSLRQRSFSAPSRVLLSGDIIDMFKMNALHLVSMRAEPLFSRPIKLPPNKNRKPLENRVPLEPSALEPSPPDKKDNQAPESAYKEQERIGSLVVWRRASTPGSQTTTAPNSPSPPPRITLPASSRPDSARTSSRPSSAQETCPRPKSAQMPQRIEASPQVPPRPRSAPRASGSSRIIKTLPCKLSKDLAGQTNKMMQSPGCASALQALASVHPSRPLSHRPKPS